MAIHEKSLIRPENLSTHENLVIDGIDVSGHWSTFIKTRVVTDYNEQMEGEISALPGGEHINRCWQCGSCTNSCTVNALNPDFNPRYWIYLIRTGMEEELLRDKDIIWQCVSCNKCVNACPREVNPEGVMKATAHWLEMKGHTPERPSTAFDDIFTDQIIARGRIEESRIIRRFFARTGQSLMQDWLIQIVKQLVSKLPITLLIHMGLEQLRAPRTKNWATAGDAISEYVAEKKRDHERALGLDGLIEMAKAEVRPAAHTAAE